jgi:hypothetical protein
METLTLQQELIDWIKSIDNKQILLELSEIKRRSSFNFREEFNKGIPLEEAKIELIKRVRAYPWKNDSIKK